MALPGKTTPGVLHCRVALRFGGRHCPVPAIALDCAQSEEAIRANDSARGYYCGQGKNAAQSCSAVRRETRKARKDAMPHERGPSPVPPSEFSCPAIADPKARFCRSPASHSPFVNGSSAISLTLRHLNSPSVRSRSAWLCSSQRTLACPAAHLKTRHPILAQSPRKRRNEPKRRATFIVARPGSSCKSRLLT
jgi:hypothetical protein